MEWSAAKRTAFRFVFAYLALYFPLLPFEHFPGAAPMLEAWTAAFARVAPWFARSVLHLDLTFEDVTESRMDCAFAWARLAFCLALAGCITVVWSAVDRRRAGYAKLAEWGHVWLRFALANAMLHYGISKVTLHQFSTPSLPRLVQPFGDASPMTLLWTFMGYAPAYQFFGGAMETLAGVLLLFRRTATLGALVAVAVMSNVVMLNLSYDVPIKLYSMHLLGLALLVLAPDARRLARFALLRATQAPRVAPHFTSMRAERGAAWGKVAYLAVLFYVFGGIVVKNLAERRAPRSPLYGIYEVETFVRDGADVPPLVTDGTRWRRIAVVGGVTEPTVLTWTMKDERKGFAAVDDAAHRTLAFGDQDGAKGVWAYETPDRDHLVLKGTLAGASIEARLRKADEASFLLMSRGFHWLSEHPFAR